MCFAKPKNWNRWLSLAQWWYNTSYHNSIKRAPFEAFFGYRTPLLPAVIDYLEAQITAGDYLKSI